jgi:hypothetical protein
MKDHTNELLYSLRVLYLNSGYDLSKFDPEGLEKDS